jgi:predicted nucleic acid-binding protein
LQEAGITVEWSMPTEVWLLAARAYRAYAYRRREQQGDRGPRRILADFLIGAHASYHHARFLTNNPKHYRTAFPRLDVLTPL